MLTRKKRIIIAILTILVVGGGMVIADKNLSENQFLLVLFSVIALGSILEIFAAKREQRLIKRKGSALDIGHFWP